MPSVIIKYRKWYKFIPPGNLTENKFNEYKKFLNEFPEKSLIPESEQKSWKDFGFAFVTMILGFIGLIVGMFPALLNIPIKVDENSAIFQIVAFFLIIMWGICFICFFIGGYYFIKFQLEIGSYLDYHQAQTAYYDKLKSRIVKSKHYLEYRALELYDVN